ncbi:hypothetical protein [Vibrio breoganii]|uniref:hypothetical protein n=1 Tax=Vibrio breoganii TaxID=553239 RepID=UPI001F539C82|nr:hypothetical protein [Vibrio breoganii]
MSKIVIISFITLLVSLLPHSALSITTLEKENLITIRNQVFGGSTLNASLTQTTLSGETPPVSPTTSTIECYSHGKSNPVRLSNLHQP